MKNKILYLGVILLLITMLFCLTGCKQNDENSINNVPASNVNNKINNDNAIDTDDNNQKNSTKNEKKQADKKNEIPETNQINETNVSEEVNQVVTKNETIEEPQKEKTFNLGNYVLHYGNYTGNCSELIETSMAFSNITINLKEDGTYTYTSTNQEVSKNRSGTYSIKNNTIILNDSEPLEYFAYGDDVLLLTRKFIYIRISREIND